MSAADMQRRASSRHPNLVRTLFVATEPRPQRTDLPPAVERFLSAALDALEEQFTPEAETPSGHALLVCRPDGYAVRELDGPPPPVGAVVTLDDARYVVLRHAPSPFPDDTRRCAILEPA